MPKVNVHSIDGAVVSQIELADSIFAVPFNPYPVQEVIRMQMANRRRGTHKVKNRTEVAGSTRKLYRQKGTGHARPGPAKSPLRRGGGIVFGPVPRDYSFNPPKKVRRKAVCIALSKKLLDGELSVMQEFDCDTIRTKDLISRLDPGMERVKTLLVLGEMTESTRINIEKSLQNVPYYQVLSAEGLNVYDLVNNRKIVLLEKSIPIITERLQS
ncbi:50S ribosomal protein L4 [bacterium]|nr:50S ribosomal protein L4 [candidate division CSSED10-310 bacterium]